MKRCKNCKYWIQDQESEKAFNENFGSCKNKKFAYIEDIEPNNLKRNKEIYNDYHVIYEDYDGHWARLKTNKDFGCIDFEEKQK